MMAAETAKATRSTWRQISPDFENYVVKFLAGEIWSRPQLDLRTRSLVTISVLAALGRTLALDLNIRIVRNNGATREEITEALLHIAPCAGVPAPWEALARVDQVFREAE